MATFRPWLGQVHDRDELVMILVTGCARSGTSLITKLLKVHGCYLGAENRVNSLYENVSVRENVLKSILTRLDADPLGQGKLPDTDHLPAWAGLRDHVHEYFDAGRPPFAYKDAKLTLLWPMFNFAFPEAKWVLVRRDKQKIIESCMRTSFMYRRKTPAQWEAWVDVHERQFQRMKAVLDLVEIWTDNVIMDPTVFAAVTNHCGLEFSLSATERAIDRKIWHR